MKKPLILIGGGGHCKACIDVIEMEGIYAIEGIIDTKEKTGTTVLQYPIVGDDSQLEEYIKKGFAFLITIGQIKSAVPRKKLYETLVEKNATLATIVSPIAVVSKYARVGKGTIIMHQAVINADASIGDNVILNTGSLIEHDVKVSEHVHISTKAVLNGGVFIGEESFVGSNSVLVQNINVGSKVIIGAGATVASDIITAGVYVGSPARYIDTKE